MNPISPELLRLLQQRQAAQPGAAPPPPPVYAPPGVPRMGLAQDQLQQQMMDSSDPNISPIQAPPIPAPWVSGHTDPRAIPAGHAGSWSNLPAPSDYNYTTRAGDTPLNHQAAQELKSKAQIDAWLAEEAKRREKK